MGHGAHRELLKYFMANDRGVLRAAGPPGFGLEGDEDSEAEEGHAAEGGGGGGFRMERGGGAAAAAGAGAAGGDWVDAGLDQELEEEADMAFAQEVTMREEDESEVGAATERAVVSLTPAK
jgi:hypothetical protein